MPSRRGFAGRRHADGVPPPGEAGQASSVAAKVSAETGNLVEAKADGLYAAVSWQTL